MTNTLLFLILSLPLLAFALYLWRKGDFTPLVILWKKATPRLRIITLLFFTATLLYGSSKSFGTRLDSTLKTIPTLIATLSTNTFSAIERLTGYSLITIKTNETNTLTIPQNATLAENIARHGAHDDGFWLFDGCTNRIARDGLVQEHPIWIHTDGTITVSAPSPNIPITELPQISTLSNITVYAPLQGSYGFLPGSLWKDFTPSRIWTASTDNNTRIITWEGALLNRNANAPVSFQAEFHKNGAITFRYSHIPTNGVTTAIFRNGNLQTFTLGQDATSALLAYIGDLGDGTSDLDNDGLTTWEEIKLHQTDPKLKDTDHDGLTDKEEVILGTNPASRDTDNDTLVDGSDPAPLQENTLIDNDNDGIPDIYETHWFGDIYTYDSLDNYDPRGFTIALDLASGMNPTSPPPSAYISTNNIVAWKLTNPFKAELTDATTNLYENTFTISRHGSWEQYFISSKPNAAGEWYLQGIELEWIDSNGIKGSLTQSSPNDSYRLPLSSDSSQTLTIRLRKTANSVTCPQELYLLAYSPTPIIDGIQRISVSNEVWYAAILDENNKIFQVELDHSTRPSISPLTPEEENAKYTLPNDTLTLTTSTLEVKSPLIQPLPSIDLSNYSQPLLRKTRQSTNEKTDATQSGIKTYLALLDPYLTYGHGHSGSYSSLHYDPDSDTYYEKDTYPLDSECLWKSWHSNADGQFQCDCKPNLNLGIDILPYDNLHTNIILSNETAISTLSIGDETIWTNSATHLTGLGHYDSDYLSNDECDDCTSCESGNCENLEGDELGSLKFRIPLGAPRKGQISGFAWFKSDNPLSINLRTLEVISRSDAHITDIIKNNERIITCHDNRGRTLTIQSIVSGIDIIVTDTASGKLEHTWRITNIEDNRIRLKKISRQNNIMSDRTYRYSDDKWTCFDNISQTREEVTVNGSFNDGLQTKETIIRDAKGKILSHTKTESERIGSYSKAVPREIYHAEKSWNGWKEAFASYYTDNENPNRNGALRLEWGNAREWRFWSYDKDGRVALTLEQFNGSILPTNDLASVEVAALDNLQKTEWLSELKVRAIATLYDYTPIQGDSSSINDNCKVRKESRYLVDNGRLTLIGNIWMRYIHSVTNGYPIVTTERIMASAQNATIDSPTNQHIIECSYDENASGLPLILRGKTLYSQDENEILTTYHHSITNDTLYTIQRQSKNGNEYPTCKITEATIPYGNLVRERSVHIDSGVSFDDTHHIYDNKNRLISTRYSDGTITTNAYSCCRLLWSQDRIGRKTLRSAKTGTDHLYYAEEDVWLAEVSTNGQYRITQHFFDALGRETNTVVFVGSTPGEAVEASASSGKVYSSSRTEYPYGGSDYAINTDKRGKVTISHSNILQDSIETTETVLTNDIEVITTKSRTHFGGGSSMRREWDGNKWTEERRFTDYAEDGKRIEYVVTESSDCGIVTNSVSTYDLLGRLVTTSLTGVNNSRIVTTVAYDGTTSRKISEVTTGSPTVSYEYDVYGDLAATIQDGNSIRNQTSYETISGEVYRIVTRIRMTGNVTNNVQWRKQHLTGLSNAVRSETHSLSSSGRETVSVRSFNVSSGLCSDVSRTENETPVTMQSLYGLPIEQIALGGRSEIRYDALGREILLALSDAVSGVTNQIECKEYDLSGNVVRMKSDFMDGRIAESSSEYDMLNREVRRTDAYGNVTEIHHDPLGRTIGVGGDKYPLKSTYDTQGRKTNGFTTRDNGLSWDETQWEFDAASGVNTAKIYADGSRISYNYTDNGKKTRTTWARGVWKQNAYNERNLVSGTTYSGTVTPSVAYTYADSGKTATAALSDGTSYAYTYDDRLLNTSESVTIGSESFTLNRTFDEFKRFQEMVVVITNVRHSAKVRLYDSENRVCGYALTNAVGRGMVVSVSYDGLYQNEIAYTMPNGNVFTVNLERESARKELVTNRCYCYDAQQMYSYSTEYDLLGRPVNATDSLSMAREWLYNNRSELASAVIGTNNYSYAYDSIGNREWAAANATTNSYVANSLNEYTQIDTSAFVYDADGNLTQDGRFTYSYDAENRLLSVVPVTPTEGVFSVRNCYDHKGRRIKKIVEQYEDGAWREFAVHTFIWDGGNIILEKITKADGRQVTKEYFWGVDKSGSEQGAGGVGGLLAVSVNGIFSIPCYDHNGNIVTYISETGGIEALYVYDAYGNTIEQSGEKANEHSFGFSTKYHDREVSLIAYQKRFYRPDHGRWLNRDPIEEEGGENLYAFCGNNPILYSDINGESFWDDLIDSAKIVVGICGVVSGAALGATTSWTGAGAVGGFAMVAIGLDQVMEGVNSIYSRVSGGPATDTSPIKEFISQSSYAITGSQNSKLEQYAISAYSGVQLASSCYGGFVSLKTAVQAVRMTYVPAHTVRITTIENGFLRYSWELKAGYWKLSGGSDAAQAVFEISVDGMTYFEHDAENENVEVR